MKNRVIITQTREPLYKKFYNDDDNLKTVQLKYCKVYMEEFKTKECDMKFRYDFEAFMAIEEGSDYFVILPFRVPDANTYFDRLSLNNNSLKSLGMDVFEDLQKLTNSYIMSMGDLPYEQNLLINKIIYLVDSQPGFYGHIKTQASDEENKYIEIEYRNDEAKEYCNLTIIPQKGTSHKLRYSDYTLNDPIVTVYLGPWKQNRDAETLEDFPYMFCIPLNSDKGDLFAGPRTYIRFISEIPGIELKTLNFLSSYQSYNGWKKLPYVPEKILKSVQISYMCYTSDDNLENYYIHKDWRIDDEHLFIINNTISKIPHKTLLHLLQYTLGVRYVYRNDNLYIATTTGKMKTMISR